MVWHRGGVAYISTWEFRDDGDPRRYVTILIGYNDARGQPVAGIMYRPLTEPVTWAAGAKSEECVMGELDMADPPHPTGMLITDGKVSPFINGLIDEVRRLDARVLKAHVVAPCLYACPRTRRL